MRRLFSDQAEERLKDVLSVCSFVLEGPAGLKDKASPLGQDGELAVPVEFEGAIGRVYLAEEKIGLLRGHLVRKRDGLRERDVDVVVSREQGVKELRVILEERFLDRSGRLRYKRQGQQEREDTDIGHSQNGSIEISPRASALRSGRSPVRR